MPAGEVDMGLMGIHYNVHLNKNAYTGIGMYGSIHGIRGGLFTLGVNTGIKSHLTSKLFFDAGLHFGGGGGAGAPDGGGAFILPHLNISYSFMKFSLEAGYSYINFFDNGNIESHQLNVGVQIPLHYSYTKFVHHGSLLTLNSTNWQRIAKNKTVQFHIDNLNFIRASKDVKGKDITNKTLRLVGVEFNSYISKNDFLLFRADGAFHGLPAGYMDILLGYGHRFLLNKTNTNFTAKIEVGAAGGGSVDTKGGVIVYPNLSLEQRLFKNTFVSIHKGFLFSPSGKTTASTYGLGLKLYGHINGLMNTDSTLFQTAKFKGIGVVVGQELYIDAQRKNNTSEDLHQIFLQVNYYLNKYWFLAGYTSFANFGNAGAYAEGLLGIGAIRKIGDSRFKLSVKNLIGAAGGGSILTGEGLIVKPTASIYLAANDKISISGSYGRVVAFGDGLNSQVVNFGLVYNLAFLTAQ